MKVKCPECKGDKYVMHPAWVLYLRENNDIMTPHRMWFSEQGYDKVPPEEVICDQCGGTGEIVTIDEIEIRSENKVIYRGDNIADAMNIVQKYFALSPEERNSAIGRYNAIIDEMAELQGIAPVSEHWSDLQCLLEEHPWLEFI